jgi:hypothetical protein
MGCILLFTLYKRRKRGPVGGGGGGGVVYLDVR